MRKRFIGDEAGQAVTEYILVVTIVILALAAYLRGIQAFVHARSEQNGAVLERYLKTGRAKLSVWGN